jgi:hypothetical protein
MLTSSVVNDIVEIVAIATIFSLMEVLSYSSTCVIVGETPIAADRCCCFTSGSFYLIIRSVTTKGLALMVFIRWGRCDDVACLNPLLGQGDKWSLVGPSAGLTP